MLELIPLCTVLVDVTAPLTIGDTPTGVRSVTDLRAVTVTGERLNGTLAGAAAADWMIRAGDLGIIDVRFTIRTHDDALVHVRYGGRLDLSNPAGGITAYVAPTFEAGDPRYTWLNRIQAVGKGKLAMENGAPRLTYEVYEFR